MVLYSRKLSLHKKDWIKNMYSIMDKTYTRKQLRKYALDVINNEYGCIFIGESGLIKRSEITDEELIELVDENFDNRKRYQAKKPLSEIREFHKKGIEDMNKYLGDSLWEYDGLSMYKDELFEIK